MHLTSHRHGFLRYLTEWQAAEIYRRRQLGMAATRRAIVRAAAEIGRTLP